LLHHRILFNPATPISDVGRLAAIPPNAGYSPAAIVPARGIAYEGWASSRRAATMPESAAEPQKTYTACVLIIGNEILSGRVQDENIAFLAKGLNEAGIRLKQVRVIPDDVDTIVGTVNEVRRAFDYVFTTGGIGPTHDDITAQCIAEAFAVKLILHPEAKRLLEGHYPAGAVNEARMRMAYVPDGAVLLPNPISRAPGFRIDNVYVMAGVPQIMQATFRELSHRLKGGAKVLSRSVSCSLGEGVLAKGLGELQARYDDLEIGSYPYFRRADFGVTLVVRSTERTRLLAATEELKALILSLGGDPHEGASED
jgi:molybdenum cofactor synthesis domain-containing protein